MKYMGVVTDPSWIKAKHQDGRPFNFEEMGIFDVVNENRTKIRIFSDEIPLQGYVKNA